METMEHLSVLGQAALEYGARGWRVFPLSPKGKIPLPKSSGFKDATTDPELIRVWWTKTPNANIGLATGNGIQVVDIDGEEGEESLRLLELEHNPLPPTHECRTGRGRHFYFQYAGELPNSTSKLAAKFDTRGDGGYVILPPSVHESGVLYEWMNELPLASLPEWIANLVRRPEPEVWTLAHVAPKADDFYELSPYVAARTHSKLHALATAPEGERNDRLVKAAFDAGRYVAGGWADELYIERETKKAARASGLEESEIEKTWKSGFDAGCLAPWEERSKYEYPSDLVKKKPKKVIHELVITWGNDLINEAPKFMWGNRIAQNSITLIAGDSGIGKSQLCLEITKAITDGVDLFDDEGQSAPRGRVLWACYEDRPVFRYRMKKAGIKDVDKVGVMEGPRDENGQPCDFSVSDIASLEHVLTQVDDVRAVFLDPWNHLLDGDENRREDNMAALSPLIAMAERQNVAVIIVAHTSKRQDGSSKDKISGHKILTNKCRSILYVAKMEDESVGVAHSKHNWSKEAATVTFTVGDDGFSWGGTSSADADELARPKEGSKILKGKSWLREVVGGGEETVVNGMTYIGMWITEVEALAVDAPCSLDTLKRGFKDMGGTKIHDGPSGRWFWTLGGAIYGEEQCDLIPEPAPLPTGWDDEF